MDISKGITCYLQHVQKMADGDSLAGKTKAEDEFSALDTEDSFETPATETASEDGLFG